MNNKKITTLFILIATIALLGIVGFTIAYFTSSTDFENEFNTALYQTEATETFVSPENWMPGDTTPKTLTVTNTGNVDVKARVCINEEWTSSNDDTLPNEVNGERMAIINLDNQSDWTKKGNCYEYNEVLEPNDTTSSFIESVTFNPNAEADLNCTTTTLNGTTTKTCTSSGDGYDNATYTLTFTVETIQANKSLEVWHPVRFVNRQVEGEITIGDEIAIGTEHFYVVNSDSNETVLISKYNLLVGDIFDNNGGYYILNKSLSSSDLGYGLQNENAKGYVSGSQIIATVPFSGTNYWDNSVYQYIELTYSYVGISGLLSEYSQNGASYSGNHYPYVYRSNIGNNIAPQIVYDPTYGNGYAQNNGYTVSYYVENYVNTLKSLGAPNTIEGRLLSYEEANAIENGSTNPIKEHLRDSSYWIGSAYNEQSMWSIASFGTSYVESCYSYARGVRPVIEIPTSELN